MSRARMSEQVYCLFIVHTQKSNAQLTFSFLNWYLAQRRQILAPPKKCSFKIWQLFTAEGSRAQSSFLHIRAIFFYIETMALRPWSKFLGKSENPGLNLSYRTQVNSVVDFQCTLLQRHDVSMN